jgi:hypothetical protein
MRNFRHLGHLYGVCGLLNRSRYLMAYAQALLRVGYALFQQRAFLLGHEL